MRLNFPGLPYVATSPATNPMASFPTKACIHSGCQHMNTSASQKHLLASGIPVPFTTWQAPCCAPSHLRWAVLHHLARHLPKTPFEPETFGILRHKNLQAEINSNATYSQVTCLTNWFDYLLRGEQKEKSQTWPNLTSCKWLWKQTLNFLHLDVTAMFPRWITALLYAVFYFARQKHNTDYVNSHSNSC